MRSVFCCPRSTSALSSATAPQPRYGSLQDTPTAYLHLVSADLQDKMRAYSPLDTLSSGQDPTNLLAGQ